MIVTITCNPAIDKTIYEDKTIFNIGGKGINVSKTLKQLNCDSLLTGFIGKDNKDIILNDLKEYNCHFIEVDGKVRTNTKRILNDELIEENENGPFISDDKLNELLNYLSNFHDEIVVISGSISKNVDEHYYERMIRLLKQNDNYIILDCANKQLVNGLKSLPDVIKPNKNEICDLFNIEFDERTIIEKARQLIDEGIKMVVISLSKDGCLFIDSENVYKAEPMKVNYMSSVGAGDSMVAAIAYSKLNGLSKEEMMKLSIACASAAVESKGSYAPTKTNIDKKINSVIIKKK